jgi:hypothetical protein
VSKEKIKYEDQSKSLITTEGKEIIVNYVLAEMADDHILDELREALENNSIYCGAEWSDFEIKFGEFTLDEIDFKKIIGIRW